MSRQPLFFSDDVEPGNPRYPNFTPPRKTSELAAMTLNRNKSTGGENYNPFCTLPRERPVHLPNAKVQAVGAFKNLYDVMNEEDYVKKEEELTYLQAVESGNVNRVREILLANVSEKDEGKDIEEDENSILENGVNSADDVCTVSKIQPLSLRRQTSYLYTKQEPGISEKKNTAAAEHSVVFEMMDLSETKPSVKTKKPSEKGPFITKQLSTGLLWQKNCASKPLPVSMVKKEPEDKLGDDDSSLGNDDQNRNVKFNKNCRDIWGRTAIFIAMIHHNLDMLELLLQNQVDIEECLYHAIDFGFYDVVELFIKYNTDTSQMITKNDSFYAPGLTPFQLAAHKNDYVMLTILYSHGFRIPDDRKKLGISFKSSDASGHGKEAHPSVLERAWDSSNNQILYYQAIASPAYMIMMFNEGLENGSDNWDFMENIFSLYGKLKKKISREPTLRSLYLPLAEQVEDFACDLLSEIRSSSDLASFLRFDQHGNPRSKRPRNSLTPVQRALEVRMKRFVAHDKSQLAISSLKLGTLFDSEHGLTTILIRISLAFIFPILCLAFSFAPDSKVGGLLCNPIVNMSCHIISEIVFLLLMILRLVLLTTVETCDCLGMETYTIDWFIFIWVLARIVNQMKRAREVSIKHMLFNAWSLNDLAVSVLFILVIALKIYDLAAHKPFHSGDCLIKNASDVVPRECNRSKWTNEEIWPITISETALAFIYLFIFLRAMELLYTDRTFGPLQLSLDKMLVDTIHFLIVFSVIFFAFAFSMTQLYWAWGRPTRFLHPNEIIRQCEQGQGKDEPCYPVYSYLDGSMLQQYWTLYGYGWGEEPPSAANIPQHFHNDSDTKGMTEIAGQAVSMIFHVWAVVVMLNMLVAMMSHSFDRVRNNAELEWKFHRSSMWMKFIRKGVYPRPPPMNLVPSTRDIKSFYNFIKNRTEKCFHPSSPVRHNAKRETSPDGGSQKSNSKYRKALTNIIQRYMRRYLLPDFHHREIDQPVNRGNLGRKASVVFADESTA